MGGVRGRARQGVFSGQLGRGKPLPHPTCTEVSQDRGCNTLGVDWGPGGWERENDLPILAGAGGINVMAAGRGILAAVRVEVAAEWGWGASACMC